MLKEFTNNTNVLGKNIKYNNFFSFQQGKTISSTFLGKGRQFLLPEYSIELGIKSSNTHLRKVPVGVDNLGSLNLNVIIYMSVRH